MRVSQQWIMAGFVLLVSAGSWFFSQYIYAVLLLASSFGVAAVGLRSKSSTTSSLLAFNLLVVVVTYGSALAHVARPGFRVDLEVLGQIVVAELTTLSGLSAMLQYSAVRLTLLVLALVILGLATLRNRFTWRTLGRYLGLAGALHLPCALALSQPALNINIYNPAAANGHTEALALGYLVQPSFVYIVAQLVSLYQQE